jgi:hypothetical protein
MNIDVDIEFACVGCNRVVNALDWGENEVLAYGAHNMVALYNIHVSFLKDQSTWASAHLVTFTS